MSPKSLMFLWTLTEDYWRSKKLSPVLFDFPIIILTSSISFYLWLCQVSLLMLKMQNASMFNIK